MMSKKYFTGIALIALAAIGSSTILILRKDADHDSYFRYVLPMPFVAADCNDQDPKIHPFANEEPNDGIDQDCQNGDLILSPEFLDNDKDGYTDNNGDCDDTNPAIYPGAIETNNDGIDSNCDGEDNISNTHSIEIMKNVVTPSLPAPPPSRATIKHLGGKILLIPEKISSAELKIRIGVQQGVQQPALLGVGLYIESDIPDPETGRDYTEYFEHLGEGYAMQDGECIPQLIQQSSFVLNTKVQSSLELPIIDLSKTPMIFDRGVPQETWGCGEQKEVDLLNLINRAVEYGASIKIALYTTTSFAGVVEEVILSYEGKEITVIEP